MPQHAESPAPPTPAERPASIRRRRWPSFLTWVLLGLAALTAYFAPAAPALARYGALPVAPDRTRTFLVAGVSPNYPSHHTRAPEDFTGLADTIMLVQLRAGERKVKILNIPRDTWTRVPSHGMGKINGANRFAGPEGLVQAVRELTGIQPEGYVLLSLDALKDVTDALGGVDVTVENAMKYDDTAAKLHIDLRPGRQRLDGTQAEAYVRFRHDRLGDIGRVQRQQAFIGALMGRLSSPAGLARAPYVIAALDRNTRTSLSRDDVANVLGALVRRPHIQATLLPGRFGAATWLPDHDAIRELAATEFRAEVVPGDPRGLRVLIVNVNAPAGSARRMKAKLDAAGYGSVTVGNADGAAAETVVQASDARVAARVARDLGFGRAETTTEAREADVIVRLATDVPPVD